MWEGGGGETKLSSLGLYLGKPVPGRLSPYQVQEGETDGKSIWKKVKTRKENIKINK
jgi:hypothetical protein